MSETNKALIRRWFDEVWNKGLESTIDELLAPHAIGKGLGDTDVDVHGPPDFTPFLNNFRATLPDMRISVEDVIAEGDTVAARIVLVGTHTGGPLSDRVTNQKVRVAGIVLVRIANGQIVEGWNSYDQLGLLRQIGALPGPEQADKFLTARS